MNNELYHHGVKGMKWGKRRFQNPDGSLTPAGKKRLAKANDHSEWAAKRILNDKIRYTDHDLKRNEKRRTRLGKKIDKYEPLIDKAHNKGNFSKRDKYLDKYFEALDKLEDHTAKYDELIARSNFYNRKLSEIESGTLKAGEDYVAHYVEVYNGTYYVKDTKLEFLTDKGRN